MIETNTELKNRFKKIKFKKLKSKKDTSRFQLFNADSMEQLEKLTPNSIDAMVTDPPYGLSDIPDMKEVLSHWINDKEYEHNGKGFMGREWDSFVPGPEIWKKCFRVLKPGAHILVFAGTRTYDLMGMSLRLAGFELKNTIAWCHSTGFPKSVNISKEIDRKLGVEREVVGQPLADDIRGGNLNHRTCDGDKKIHMIDITKPASPQAKEWSGFGTDLKPAYEPILLFRKPISEKTIVENVLKHRTGSINVDGCRVGTGDKLQSGRHIQKNREYPSGYKDTNRTEYEQNPQGRFPSNFLIQHSSGCKKIGKKKVKSSQLLTSHQLNESENKAMSGKNYKRNPRQDWGKDGTETVDKYNCEPQCLVRKLDEMSGMSKSPDKSKNYGKHSDLVEPGNNGTMNDGWNGDKVVQGHADTGGASRFFQVFEPEIKAPFVYIPKPSTSEKNAGLSGEPEKVGDGRKAYADVPMNRGETLRKNVHPTVKSVRLMRYLVRLITPPGGIVLDAFLGSGTTGIAAMKEGMRFIGIEKEEKYFKIAKSRISDATL